jgi:hypothetical protein
LFISDDSNTDRGPVLEVFYTSKSPVQFFGKPHYGRKDQYQQGGFENVSCRGTALVARQCYAK